MLTITLTQEEDVSMNNILPTTLLVQNLPSNTSRQGAPALSLVQNGKVVDLNQYRGSKANQTYATQTQQNIINASQRSGVQVSNAVLIHAENGNKLESIR
jgi:hypothetical protein